MRPAAATPEAPENAAAPGMQRAPAPVPTEVRTMVESGTGADLSDVPVHRGADVSATATQLSARAYTTGGEVHLPQEHGPLTSGTGRSLLAHELTHVAQQRTLGSSLPPESSPAGARLEAEAQANEHAALHGGGAQRSPLPVVAGPGPGASGSTWSAPTAASEPPGRAAASAFDTSSAVGPSGGSATGAFAPQRAPLASSAVTDPGRAAVSAGVAALGSDGSVHFRTPGAARADLTLARPGDVQRAAEGASPSGLASSSGPSSPPPPSSVATAAGGPPGVQRAPDVPDTGLGQPSGDVAGGADDDDDGVDGEEELEDLARRLWPRIHRRLRTDLLIDRERSGYLVDRF